MTAPTTSVVVVSYNTGPSLWVCLRRVMQQHGLRELIVVNNGNNAQTERYLKAVERQYEQIKLVNGQGNVGFSAGCNLGAAQATGDNIVLLNPDAILMDDHALLRLTELLGTDNGEGKPVMLVGGVLRNSDGTEQRASRRNMLTPANALSEGLKLNKIAPSIFPSINIEHTPLPENPAAVSAVSGACMAMRREDYERIGGMDEGYFLHVEDFDLCKRVQNAQGDVWVHPHIDILHYRSTSRASTLFVERKKMHGFLRFFRLHGQGYFLRYVAQFAAIAQMGVKTFLSLFQELLPQQVLYTPFGVKRVAAIVRGMLADQAVTLPEGSVVMVTGASTPVGLFTIGRLLSMGCKVLAVSHRSQIGYFHPHLWWVRGDFNNPGALQQVLAKYQCQYAIHAAPIWHASTLMPLMRSAGVGHVVAVSSTSINGKADSSSRKEQHMVQRLLEGEEAVKNQAAQLGMRWSLLRPTMIYGSGLDQNVSRIARIIDRIRLFPVQRPALGKRAPIHADDVAKAALRSLVSQQAAGKTYALGGGTIMPYRAIAERVGKIMHVSAPIMGIPALAVLCRIFHPFFPSKIPHAELALRMQHDLVFPDEDVTTELHMTMREFLSGGMADLGEYEEEACRSLLPVSQDS